MKLGRAREISDAPGTFCAQARDSVNDEVPTTLLRIRPFRLDPSERQLLRAGQVMPLTPKVFDTLLLFVENNNLLLTKDEMIGRLWPDSFVEESNLAQNVSMLRRALGEQPNGKPYIETVPKRGYRFTAEVLLRSEEQPAVARGESAFTSFGPELAGAFERRANEAPELTPAPINQPSEPQESRPQASNGAKSSITPLVTAAWRHRRVAVWAAIALIVIAAGGAYLLSTPTSPSRSEVKVRLAVLPFRNLGPDKSADFLGRSLADEVIAKLNYISALTVRPSAYVQKYAGQEIDPGQVASDLRDDLRKAGEMFEKSVGLDPTYAPSWAYLGAINTTLASIYFEGRESYDKARQAYDRALELDPSQIEARIFKANLLTDTGYVEEAVPLLRSVIGANPNLAQAHWNLAYAYRFGGLLRESISEGERSRQINGEIKADNSVFNGYLYDGQYEKFIQSLAAREDSAYVTFYRGLGHYCLKRWKEASAYFDRAYQLDHKLMPAQIGKALSHGLAGRKASGLKLLKEAEEKIIKSGVADAEGVYKIAQAFAALNDRPPALRMLRRSIEGGFFCYPYFTNDPLLDNLRGEAEFAELMEIARRRHEEFKRQFSAP